MVYYEASPKRRNGQYFTEGNPFRHPAFSDWATRSGLLRQRVLEPFAGANSLIWHPQEMELCRSFASFGIELSYPAVQYSDTIPASRPGYEGGIIHNVV